MSLLANNTIQTNIITHQVAIKKEINQTISRLTSIVNAYSGLASFLHEEAQVAEIVDNQDSNANLRLIGRKADDLRALADQLDALKALKGANNTETATNMVAHKAATSYDHATFKAQFEPE